MKKWYESKTLWLNGLTLLAALLAMPELSAAVGGHVEALMVIQSAVNIVLRFVTSTAIGSEPKA